MATGKFHLLTETAIKNAKPKEKDYNLNDGGSLQLLVTTAGGKLWRYRYRFDGKERAPLAIGKYPEITLKDARERHTEARKLLANGIDPGEARKEEKAAKVEASQNTFGRVAEEWFEAWREGKAVVTVRHVRDRLDHFILPLLAARPVAEIKAADVLEVLKPIEAKALLDTVQRVKINISQVLQRAIATGKRELADPCPYLNTVIKANTVKHHAAFTKPKDVARLLKAIKSHAGNQRTSPFVSAALRLLPLLFCRPGELIAMRWADIDLEKAEWTYTVSKTKADHLVPLSRQAVAILRGLEPYRSGEYVFPSQSRAARHMSNMAINRALQDMGIDTKREHTGHGFRAMARTMLAEQLHCQPEVIEHQLSHAVPDTLGTAYNRTKYLPQRKEMMQRWADYLDGLRMA